MDAINDILEAEAQIAMPSPSEYPLAESTSCSSEDDQENIISSTDHSEESASEDTDEEYEDLELIEARRQWEESLVQLNHAVNWVILPLLGKFFGRRAALWTWKWVADKLYK